MQPRTPLVILWQRLCRALRRLRNPAVRAIVYWRWRWVLHRWIWRLAGHQDPHYSLLPPPY